MEVLVISACTSEKEYDGEAPIDCEDIDTNPREALVQEYREYVLPAAEMYTGRGHQQVQQAVESLAQYADVEWNILSAGFGLLDSSTEIPYYECTFNDSDSVRSRAKRLGLGDEATRKQRVRKISREKDVHSTLTQKFEEGPDLVFLTLSEWYLTAVSPALDDIPDGITAFAFAAEGYRDQVADCHWVPARTQERELLGTDWFRLRGQLLRSIVETISGIEDLERIVEDPENAYEFAVEEYRENSK